MYRCVTYIYCIHDPEFLSLNLKLHTRTHPLSLSLSPRHAPLPSPKQKKTHTHVHILRCKTIVDSYIYIRIYTYTHTYIYKCIFLYIYVIYVLLYFVGNFIQAFFIFRKDVRRKDIIEIFSLIENAYIPQSVCMWIVYMPKCIHITKCMYPVFGTDTVLHTYAYVDIFCIRLSCWSCAYTRTHVSDFCYTLCRYLVFGTDIVLHTYTYMDIFFSRLSCWGCAYTLVQVSDLCYTLCHTASFFLTPYLINSSQYMHIWIGGQTEGQSIIYCIIP